MRNGNLITWIAALCVTVTQVSDTLAADWVEFPVYAVMDDQQAPDIYGNVIAWEDNRNGMNNWDIYTYDLSTGSEQRITTNPFNQNNPAIYKNFIVIHKSI